MSKSYLLRDLKTEKNHVPFLPMQKCMFPDNHGDILGHVRNPDVLVERAETVQAPEARTEDVYNDLGTYHNLRLISTKLLLLG